MLRPRFVGDRSLSTPGDPAPKVVGDSFEGEAGFSRNPSFGVDTPEPGPARLAGDSLVGDCGAGWSVQISGDRMDPDAAAAVKAAALQEVQPEVQGEPKSLAGANDARGLPLSAKR